MSKPIEAAQSERASDETRTGREHDSVYRLAGELAELIDRGELTDAEAFARFAGATVIVRQDELHGTILLASGASDNPQV